MLGINVPSPYFLQKLLVLGGIHDAFDKDYPAVAARIYMSLEVSERDEAFVRKICGNDFDWWEVTDGHYPSFDELSESVANRIYKVSDESFLSKDNGEVFPRPWCRRA